MKDKRQNISSVWFRATVLMMYTFFFTVQLFFNLEINNGADIARSFSIQHLQSETVKGCFQKNADSNKNHKKSFRLNKRFQHECIPATAYAVGAPALHFIETDTAPHLSECLFDSIIPVNSLRGPPARIV